MKCGTGYIGGAGGYITADLIDRIFHRKCSISSRQAMRSNSGATQKTSNLDWLNVAGRRSWCRLLLVEVLGAWWLAIVKRSETEATHHLT